MNRDPGLGDFSVNFPTTFPTTIEFSGESTKLKEKKEGSILGLVGDGLWWFEVRWCGGR